MSRTTLQWQQFRRLLLGTVVEVLLEQQTRLEFTTVRIAFDEQSAFQVPRFNNYMRFVGALEAELIDPLSEPRRTHAPSPNRPRPRSGRPASTRRPLASISTTRR